MRTRLCAGGRATTTHGVPPSPSEVSSYFGMVCTSSSRQASHPPGRSETPWSIFSEQNCVFLVSFQLSGNKPEAQEVAGKGTTNRLPVLDRLAIAHALKIEMNSAWILIGPTAVRDRVPDVLEEGGVAGGRLEHEEINGQNGERAGSNRERHRGVVVSIRRTLTRWCRRPRAMPTPAPTHAAARAGVFCSGCPGAIRSRVMPWNRPGMRVLIVIAASIDW